MNSYIKALGAVPSTIVTTEEVFAFVNIIMTFVKKVHIFLFKLPLVFIIGGRKKLNMLILEILQRT